METLFAALSQSAIAFFLVALLLVDLAHHLLSPDFRLNGALLGLNLAYRPSLQ